MMGDRKQFSTIFTALAVVTLLVSCCRASSSFLPRVTRTSDAVIIDFPSSQMAYPGPVPLPAFNPYATRYYQQQPMFHNGWPTLNGLLSLNTRTRVPPTTTTTTTPAPAIQCGLGPTRYPQLPGVGETNEAKKNSWPFMVFVSMLSTLLNFPVYSGIGVPCSGVLIGDTKVLLPAQCLEKMPFLYTSVLIVSTGVHSLDASDAQMTRRVTRAVIHGRYNAGNHANDIAILTLDMPVIFSKTVGPVCLPPASADPDQYADKDAVALGWGTTADMKSAERNVDALQQAPVNMISNALCREEDYFGKYISELNICVKSVENQPCVNDIGSPIVVQSSPGTWTVIGLHSYAEGCGVGGLKTRVSAFRTWIDQNMN